jgi:hypothetical protein
VSVTLTNPRSSTASPDAPIHSGHVAIEVIEEEHCPAIAELPRAVPVAPTDTCVGEIQVPYGFKLFGAGRNRIFEHHMPSRLSRDTNFHH